MEEINKSLKENKEKAIKQVKATVQDLKTETEAIRKTQTEWNLEMENLGKGSGTTEASINNRIQKMEEKILGIEDMLEEIDLVIKENVKSHKFLTQNIQ